MSKNLSRKMSYLLRHNPEDLVMDKEGWVKVSDLLDKLGISFVILTSIVETNDKKRFVFSEDQSKIRAAQGHSAKLNLKVKFKEVQFPVNYFHGTSITNIASIMKYGLKSQTRDKVHLSKDKKTATDVGMRHAKNKQLLEILVIDGKQMKRDGLKIYESENGVILVDFVPSKYIS